MTKIKGGVGWRYDWQAANQVWDQYWGSLAHWGEPDHDLEGVVPPRQSYKWTIPKLHCRWSRTSFRGAKGPTRSWSHYQKASVGLLQVIKIQMTISWFLHSSNLTKLIRGRPNVHHVEDWPWVGVQCGPARSRIRWDIVPISIVVNFTFFNLFHPQPTERSRPGPSWGSRGNWTLPRSEGTWGDW